MNRAKALKILVAAVVVISAFTYQTYTVRDLKVRVDILSQSQATPPKIILMDFDRTVKSWNKLDPTGAMAMKVLESTIATYNKNGYVILDSSSVIGGRAWMPVINAYPENIKASKTSKNGVAGK